MRLTGAFGRKNRKNQAVSDIRDDASARRGTLLKDSPATAFFMAHDGLVSEASAEGAALARLMAQSDDALAIILSAQETGTIAESRVVLGGGQTFWLVALPDPDGVLVIGRDTTLSDSVTQALIESRTLLRSLLDQSATLALEIDADGLVRFVSPAIALGDDTSDWLGASARRMLWPKGDAPARNPLNSRVEKTFPAVPVSFGTKPSRLDMVIKPVFEEDGTYRGAQITCRDVTEHADKMRSARATSLRLNIQQRIMGILAGAETADQLLNDAAEVLIDTVRAEAVWILVSHGRGLAPVAVQGGLDISLNLDEIWARCRAQVATEATGEPVQSMIKIAEIGHDRLVMLLRAVNELQGVVVIARDTEVAPWSDQEVDLLEATAGMLTEAFEKATLIDKLQKLSSQDMLTGVHNRHSIGETINTRLRYQRRLGNGGCLLFIDLDHFKEINDTLGHQAGDDALRLVAELLRTITRPNDLIGRYGGDEFVVWLDGADADQAVKRGEDMIAKMAGVREAIGASHLKLGASVGVCQSDPACTESFDDLSNRADEALYEVKKAGKGRVAIAAPLGPVSQGSADEKG